MVLPCGFCSPTVCKTNVKNTFWNKKKVSHHTAELDLQERHQSQVWYIHFPLTKTCACEIYKHILTENIPLYFFLSPPPTPSHYPPLSFLFLLSPFSTPRPIIKHVSRAVLSWRGSLLRWTSRTAGPHDTHMSAVHDTLYLELLAHSHSHFPLAVFFIHPFMSVGLSPVPF